VTDTSDPRMTDLEARLDELQDELAVLDDEISAEEAARHVEHKPEAKPEAKTEQKEKPFDNDAFVISIRELGLDPSRFKLPAGASWTIDSAYEFLTKHGVKPDHIKIAGDKPRPLSPQEKTQRWANALYGAAKK